MVHAVSAQFPFTGGEGLLLYRPDPLERYFPIAPGIELSVQPREELSWERSAETLIYNRQGQVNSPLKKGTLVDTYL